MQFDSYLNSAKGKGHTNLPIMAGFTGLEKHLKKHETGDWEH